MEAAREGRRAYVKLAGPRYPSDRELLRNARTRVEQLDRRVGEVAGIADRLERERDEARAETETALNEYRKLQDVLVGEQNGHQKARRWLSRLGIAVAVLAALLAVTVLVAWWLITCGVGPCNGGKAAPTGRGDCKAPSGESHGIFHRHGLAGRILIHSQSWVSRFQCRLETVPDGEC